MRFLSLFCLLVTLPAFAQPDPLSLVPLYKAAWEQRKTARAAEDLGLFLARHVSKEQAAVYLREALAIDQKTYPPNHARIGQDLENLIEVAPDARRFIEQAAENQDRSIAARNLARLSSMAETRARAIAYARKALAAEPLKKAVRMNDLALLLDPTEALPLLEQALALQKKTIDPERATTQSNLANLLLAMGRLDRAEVLQRQALAVFEATLGAAHPRVAAALSGLGDIARERGRKAEARGLYQRALAIDEKAYGPNHPEVTADREALAALER